MTALRRVLRSATGRVLGGNVLGAGAGFLVLMLLARGLGPEEFGRLAPALAVMDLGQLLIDTLFAAGAVTVAVRSRPGSAARRDAVATGVVLRAGAGAAFALAVVLASAPLARAMGAGEDAAVIFALAGLAGGCLAAQGALAGSLQIAGRFGLVALTTAAKNGLRLALVGVLALAGWLTVDGAAMALSVAAVAALGIALATSAGWDDGRFQRSAAAEMLAINRWMMLAALAIVSGRLDILLLTALAEPREAAFYAASIQLCVAVGVVSQAIVTTTLPRIAAFHDRAEARVFLRRWGRRVPFLLLPVAVAPLAAPFVLPLLLGPGFDGIETTFVLLFVSSLMTLAMNPVLLVLFPLGSARLFGIAAAGQVAAKTAIAIAVIPTHGAAGVAAADVATKAVTILIVLAALRPRLAGEGRLSPEGGAS